MCIRDRRPKQQQAGEPEDDYGEEDYEDDGPPWDEDEENSEAVSYTHLDVYKRQSWP